MRARSTAPVRQSSGTGTTRDWPSSQAPGFHPGQASATLASRSTSPPKRSQRRARPVPGRARRTSGRGLHVGPACHQLGLRAGAQLSLARTTRRVQLPGGPPFRQERKAQARFIREPGRGRYPDLPPLRGLRNGSRRVHSPVPRETWCNPRPRNHDASEARQARHRSYKAAFVGAIPTAGTTPDANAKGRAAGPSNRRMEFESPRICHPGPPKDGRGTPKAASRDRYPSGPPPLARMCWRTARLDRSPGAGVVRSG